MRLNRARFWLRGVSLATVSVLLGITLSFSATPDIQPAWAGNAGVCETTGGTAHNNLKVYPSHGKVFYIDSGQNQSVDAAYAGYRVESSTTQSNLWAKVDSFTGGVVGLANPNDAYFRIGDVGAGSTLPAFFLLTAGVSTTTAQSHVFRVYSGDPRLSGSSELYNCTYSFVSVKETIKAAANKVTDVATVATDQIGGELRVTVEGNSGTIGSGTSSPDGEVMWFTPAARSSWPSSSLRLKSTTVDFFSNSSRNTNQRVGSGPYLNQLVFNSPKTLFGESKVFYTAIYTFTIVGPVSTSVQAIPIAQISSGTQIKHTDVTGITSDAGATISISAPVNVTVEKTVSSSIAGSGATRDFSYTVTLSNSGGSSVDLDQIVDQPSAGLSFTAGSAFFSTSPTVALANPVTDSSGKLVFQGPFTIPSGGSKTLTYKMTSSCSSGSFSYTNVAYGTVGSLVIGKNGSTVSGVGITGSCPPSTGTVAVSDLTLDPEPITQPASSVAETTATLNGSVDPNGVAGQAVTFVWGTSSSLAGGATVPLSTSTSSSNFYAVSTPLTGLSAGTRYYYQVTIGGFAGEILSFVTTEVVGTPTVDTDPVSGINASTTTSVTFNGTVDPNQVAGGATVFFLYGLTGSSGASSDCSAVSYGSPILVQIDSDDDGFFDDGAEIFQGAFPANFSSSITGLVTGKYYCVYARTTWSSGAQTLDDTTPVLFRTNTMYTQTITFPTPSITSYNATETLAATVSDSSGGSALTVTYGSNTPSVCTVAGGVVTIVGAGTCSLTAYQTGDDSRYPATPVTVTFTVASYTVTYDLNGATGSAPVDASSPYASGQNVTVTATVPSRTGYSFTGWDTQANGAGTDYATSSTLSSIAANTTLYAQWTVATTYTVTYGANGGTGAPSTSTHNQGTTVTVSATEPTRTGYRFVDWRDAGNVSYAPSASLGSIAGNVVLTAQWVQTFTVTYNANSATSGTVPAVTTHDTSATVTVAANSGSLARTGYTFAGWQTASGGGSSYAAGSGTFTISADTILYAKWTAVTYTVTYDANSATSGSVPTDSTAYSASATVTVAANSGSLARTGYTFAGWQTASGGGSSYAAGSGTFTISADTILYAKWTTVTYTVTYGANGGTGAPSTSTHNQGTTVTVSATEPTRSGYRFVDWRDASNVSYAPSASLGSIAGNVVLTAQWVQTFTVTYNANSATSGTVPAVTTHDTSATVTVAANSGSLARTGYTFAGWQTASGGGSSYAAGSGTFTISADTILYAKWTTVTYTVTYDGNSDDGSGSVPAPQTSTGGSSVTVPANTGTLAKTGKIFGGWALNTPGTGTIYAPGDSYVPTGNVTLYVLWLTPYTVTYDANGASSGTPPLSRTWGSGQTATVAANPGNLALTGRTFSGWQTAPSGGATYAAGSGTFVVSGDITLYARWTTNSQSSSGGGSTSRGGSPATTPTAPTLIIPRILPPRALVPTPAATPQTTPNLSPQSPTETNGNNGGASTPGAVAPERQGLGQLRSTSGVAGLGTIDLGQGVESVGQTPQASGSNTPAGSATLESARRSISQLSREVLGGFAPGSSTYIEIIGARTGARFVVTEAEVVDSFTLVRAIQNSIEAQRSDFFSIDSARVANAPVSPDPWTNDERDSANYLFTSSGLLEPTLLSDLPLEQYTNWVSVETSAETFVPGSTVYLTLTSQPIVLAEGIVDRNGEIQLSGTIPAELLTAGEHRVRLVGIRALDGASVDDQGEIQVSNALLQEIERFDLGTQSTIAFFGENLTGDSHAALRVIPLIPSAPWWTLIFIGLGLVLFGSLRRWGPIRKNVAHNLASAAVFLMATPAVILGWISTVTAVVWWGLALGLLAMVLYYLVRPKRSISRES
jgi:uncharacterized repeat protein (TIGR02543 family)